MVRTWIAAFAALSLALAATAAPAAESSPMGGLPSDAAVRAAIDSANAVWCNAYRRHDPPGIVSVYTDDAVSLSSDGEVARGSERLLESSVAIMRYNPIDATVTTRQVWVVDATAYEFGRYTLTFVPEVSDTVTFSERYIAQWWRMPDGLWKTRLKIGLPAKGDTEIQGSEQ